MILVLTNNSDVTADYLLGVVERRGLQAIRLDTDALVRRVTLRYRSATPTIVVDEVPYSASDISSLWYRRPERLRAASLEATPEGKYTLLEWTEALEGFLAHVPSRRWINHPAANARASHKMEQLTRAIACGLRVPDTLITQVPEDAIEFARLHDGRVVAKPLAQAYIDRDPGVDTQIYTSRITAADLADAGAIAHCPTLLQQYIVKESDVRVTIIDNEIHSVEMLAADASGNQRCDIRRNNMTDVEYRSIAMPSATKQCLLRLISNYHLRFAAVDFVIDKDGCWFFLEVNPNGQWAWLDLAAGSSIAESFIRAFERDNLLDR